MRRPCQSFIVLLHVILHLTNLLGTFSFVIVTCPDSRPKNLVRLYVTKKEEDLENAQPPPPPPQYGVSYIGGDPCGSKYNNDPFDVQVQKPGMPDDMKARIQALVDKKVAEEKQAQSQLSNDDKK